MGLVRGDSYAIDDRVGGAELERYFESAHSALIHIRSGYESKCPTMFRPLPEFDGASPMPGFAEVGGEIRPTAWFVKLPAIQYAGSAEKMSFIAYDPYAEQQGRYDRSENPYVLARQRLWKASGDKDATFKGFPCSAWRVLLTGREAIFPDVRIRYFMQGPLYMGDNGSRILNIGGKPVPFGLHPGQRHLPIISTSSTGGQALVNLGMKLFRDSDGELDITALEYPDVLVLANEGQHDRASYEITDESMALDMSEEADLMGNGEADAEVVSDDNRNASYAAWSLNRVRIPPPAKKVGDREPKEKYIAIKKNRMPPLITMKDEIIARRSDLFEIFSVPGHEQICEWMARMFADKAILLEFAWKDRPEFFSAGVRGILARRKQVAMGSNDLGDTPGEGGTGDLFADGDELLGDDDLDLDVEGGGDDDFFVTTPAPKKPAPKAPAGKANPGTKVADAAKNAMRRAK